MARLERGESAEWFEHWLDGENADVLIMCDNRRKPVAAALTLRLGAASIEAGSTDPCLRALFWYLGCHAPLRGGRRRCWRAFCSRTALARPTPVSVELVAKLNGLMFTPGISLLAWVSDLASDRQAIEIADARLLPDTEYTMGGRRYAITAHDIRRQPPLEWSRNCVERILRNGDAPELTPPGLVLLDRPEFEALC